jgi:hypothetical protein
MRLDQINSIQVAPMSLQLTTDDRLRLEKLRLERLRAFFCDSLALCPTYVSQPSHLVIACPEPWLVDRLLDEIEALCWYAWIVVGASYLSIYFAGEEVYETATVINEDIDEQGIDEQDIDELFLPNAWLND